MDLGYNRKKFVDFCIQKNELMKVIHQKKFKTKNGKTKEVLHGVINKKCKYHIPVITDCKMIKRIYRPLLILLKLNWVEIYFFTSGKHLNNYDLDMMEGVDINYLNLNDY